jgi:hypothetical protein
MKKVFLVTAVIFGMFIVSCGTNSETESEYQKNANQLLTGKSDTVITNPLAVTISNRPLTLIDSVMIPAHGPFNPKTVFSTSLKDGAIANFSHWDNFDNWLYDNAVPTKSVDSFQLLIYTLNRGMNDWEIQSLTGNKPLSVDEYFWAQAYMISHQVNGTPGKLLTSGYANIFHTMRPHDNSPVAACVDWRSVYGHWLCYAFEYGDWYAGSQVFVRGN